ncbi:Glucarate dehydratase [Achaetomium macrosporum]|uniref:Glucarate dehydratase n=1 Tax=Achaetomium macrosporum TaxID=79813 RepID=A0AAN7BZV6_9PEZI|nr:Glucarate dehydratase [Achaetomium macrosporum]
MKLETLFTAAWLASTATAIGPASPKSPPRLKGYPAKMDNWRWPNLFASPQHKKFDAACDVERTFQAREFLLDDLAEDPPTGLLPYRDALKNVFSTRDYPGSWDGIDPHGYDRNLLVMGYADVPLRVREWIEHQERSDGPGKGLFAVYQMPMSGTRVLNTIKVPAETPVSEEWRARDERRVAIFAPGAVHEVLPLWVAEGSGCEEALLDLSKYSAKLVDGGVVAYPVHHSLPKRSQNKRDMEFTVKAQVLKLKEGENAEDVEEAAQKTEETEKVERAEEAGKPSYERAEETKSADRDEL